MATDRLVARLNKLLLQGSRFRNRIPGFSKWTHQNQQAFHIWRGEVVAAITELGRWGKGHIEDIKSVTDEAEVPPRVFAALEAACRTAEHRRQTERELEIKKAAKAQREKKQQEKERERAMKAEKQKRGQEVFLVHGHDHKLLHEAARVLNRLLGKDPIILFEQPGKAKTLVEKLEHYGPQAGFGIAHRRRFRKGSQGHGSSATRETKCDPRAWVLRWFAGQAQCSSPRGCWSGNTL